MNLEVFAERCKEINAVEDITTTECVNSQTCAGQEKSQELDEGVPRVPDIAISARTDRKRFPRRFAENPHFTKVHAEYQSKRGIWRDGVLSYNRLICFYLHSALGGLCGRGAAGQVSAWTIRFDSR